MKSTTQFLSRLEHLCDIAQENHCPNHPPCSISEGVEVAMDPEEWCGVCLLAEDVRKLVRGAAPKRSADR